jgi:FKBP-type peptidyl-prolyl cis-trans isomerase FklB
MRYLCLTVLVSSLFAATAYGQGIGTAQVSVLDKASYGIGQNIGRTLKADGVDVNIEYLLAGVRDALQGAQSRFTDEQLDAAIQEFSRAMQAKREQETKIVGEKNQREGQTFLLANRGKPGVKTMPSGLQYQVLRPGNGRSPAATDTVKVHYHGQLLNGTVFDSSVQRNQPAVFPVNRVIPGWTEALQMMRVGDKWRLFIPANLAYGAEGAGAAIGPHAVLIFDVELLGIQ